MFYFISYRSIYLESLERLCFYDYTKVVVLLLLVLKYISILSFSINFIALYISLDAAKTEVLFQGHKTATFNLPHWVLPSDYNEPYKDSHCHQTITIDYSSVLFKQSIFWFRYTWSVCLLIWISILMKTRKLIKIYLVSSWWRMSQSVGS